MLAQCSTNVVNSNVINLDPALKSNEEVLLSNYASAVDYIALETQEGIVLPGVNFISLKVFDNEFFVCNMKMSTYNEACYRYTNEGKYLNSVGIKGRAPGEFAVISNLDVDSKEKLVKVYDMNKLVAYDFSGKFVHETNKDSLSEEEAVKCAMGKPSDEFIYKNYQEASVIRGENDTIRNIDGTIRYILDYGTYKIRDGEQENVKLLTQKYMETKNFVKLDILFSVKGFPNLSQRERFCEVVFDKKTREAKSIKSNENFPFDGFVNDIDGGAPFLPTYAADNKMYQILDAVTFIDVAKASTSEKMKNVAAKLTPESNPVVITATLK